MNKQVMIVSGPTLEPIDPIRYLSNRSSGKTGYCLAREARKRGYRKIFFISGPTPFIPEGIETVMVETAAQMQEAAERRFASSDIILMAAAVCDFRVKTFNPRKIKHKEETLILELEPNPDILQGLGQRKRADQILVGFAAETDSGEANAREKMLRKNLDMIVLNEISPLNPAFGADENQVTLIRRTGAIHMEKCSKEQIASAVWNEIESMASLPAKSDP